MPLCLLPNQPTKSLLQNFKCQGKANLQKYKVSTREVVKQNTKCSTPFNNSFQTICLADRWDNGSCPLWIWIQSHNGRGSTLNYRFPLIHQLVLLFHQGTLWGCIMHVCMNMENDYDCLHIVILLIILLSCCQHIYIYIYVYREREREFHKAQNWRVEVSFLSHHANH